MQVEYTGRQVTVTPALRKLADEGIERIQKILPRAVSAHIILSAGKIPAMRRNYDKDRACRRS